MDNGLTASEKAFLDASVSMGSTLGVEQVCGAILDAVERLFDARSCWILLHDPSINRLVTCAFRGPGAESYANVELPLDCGIVGLAFTRGEPFFVPDAESEHRWFDPDRLRQSGLRSVLTMPLAHGDIRMGVVGLDSLRFTPETPPGQDDLTRLRGIAAQAALGIRNAKLIEQLEADRSRLRRLLQERRQLRSEVDQLRDEVKDAQAFSTIVGDSEPMQQILQQISVVAPADSTVLLIGETGTGKELVARAIHDRSRRAANGFVAVNCAALPDALVESELFGHEKGSFTGAHSRKAGKFELADRGTLLLDEIGDLPADAQAKLLRVLQEREIQRIGGTRPVPVNVRVIAATNQNLEAAIGDGRFRRDLYYRLSVFPVRVPALRERPEDIPVLVNHFLRRYSCRLHKPIPRLSSQAMEQLVAYDWPGNVRELQNLMERAVILVRGTTIGPELVPIQTAIGLQPSNRSDLDRGASRDLPGTILPFFEAERRAIVQALETTGWRVSGATGAAQVLGLKPTTLHAKMKKLGIHRPSVCS